MTNMVFTVQAPRWCRVRADSSPDGDFFPLDDDGFLGSEHIVAPPGSEATAGLLVAPGDVAREGATVLLGEPGAGKTSVFRLLVQGLPMWDDPFVSDGADRCVWVGTGLLRRQIAATYDYLAPLTVAGHLEARGYGVPHIGRIIATERVVYLTPYSADRHGRESPVIKYRRGETYDVLMRLIDKLWVGSGSA
ncbi:hypothetical protein AB0O72_05440 [Streptomyces sp. NPDC088106]|uniref:hypothetical protein n=2 Tax=Streptomyces TaxID=1883 RepID=UPI003449C078